MDATRERERAARRRAKTRRLRGITRFFRILLAADIAWITIQAATSGAITFLALISLGCAALNSWPGRSRHTTRRTS